MSVWAIIVREIKKDNQKNNQMEIVFLLHHLNIDKILIRNPIQVGIMVTCKYILNTV